MDEKIFKDSEWYKHASEITLPASVHWHFIRFTCSRREDNGIPYVEATKEIQSTPDEIVVEIAAKPPLAGTAEVVEINATEMNREVLIARARSHVRGTWIKDNTKQPRTYTSESLEPNGVFNDEAGNNDKAFPADVQIKLNDAWQRNKSEYILDANMVFDFEDMVVRENSKYRALKLVDDNGNTLLSHNLLHAPEERNYRSFFVGAGAIDRFNYWWLSLIHI